MKRNYWLFILEILVLISLVFLPYNNEELIMLISILFLLIIRDLVILKLSYRHMGKFIARGKEIFIEIIHGSKIRVKKKEWLSEIELEIKYTLGFPVLYFTKGNETIFKQYSFGMWSAQKMNEFVNSFYSHKKDQALWKMYKGQD